VHAEVGARDRPQALRELLEAHILKARLDHFVATGIMRRHRYSEQPELYEYLLTDKGRALAAWLAS
jgi:DNA-binding HxlR family transcriptional regulator